MSTREMVALASKLEHAERSLDVVELTAAPGRCRSGADEKRRGAVARPIDEDRLHVRAAVDERDVLRRGRDAGLR
jgi:hypothetical protein